MADRTTLHLTPRDVWERQSASATYLPEAFDTDGFIHCTDGDENLLHIANLFYRLDPREFVVLSVAVDRLTSEVKYEGPGLIYPHIYGPLNTDAVVGVREAARSGDGAFVRFRD